MKNDIEYYRKFKIIDFSANNKKFKDYLELCKKNEYFDEKIYILQNLINFTNEKSVSISPDVNYILSEATFLCVLTVIFSDFEIENFFKLTNFSVNFQRTILLQAINYTIDRANEYNEIIYLKYQFWVLKTINKNAELTGVIGLNSHISQEELNQSLINLEKEISKERIKEKYLIFILKVSYELGFYYYLTNNYQKMKICFEICLNKKSSLKTYDLKSIYFNIEDTKDLIKIFTENSEIFELFSDEKNANKNADIHKEYLDMEIEVIKPLKDFDENNQNIFQEKLYDNIKYLKDTEMEIEHDQNNKSVNLDKINKKKSYFIIDFSEENNINTNLKIDLQNFFDKNTLLDSNSKNLIEKFSIDDQKTFETFSLEEIVKYSKNLVLIALKNCNYNFIFKIISLDSKFYEASSYINKVSELITTNQTLNLNEQEKKILQNAKKDISYYQHLIILIDLIYKKEEKLPKTLLKNLSCTILNMTLTDDLEISGLIHGLIMNFNKTITKIYNYFSDFVEFFQKTSTEQQDKVNQISYIYNVLKIINEIIEKNGASVYSIDGEGHNQIMNLIFYWVKNLKENNTIEKDNILFILIKTIKNSDYLLVLKIIYLGAYKYLLEKRNIISSIFNDEIYDKINQNNPNCFNLETLINENKNNPKLKNKTIFFKEDNKTIYNFKIEYIEYFEEILVKLIKKTEKKIVKFSNFTEIEILERRINILFFENYTSISSITNQNSSSVKKNPLENNNLNISQKLKDNLENITDICYDSTFKKIKIINFTEIIKEYVKYFQCNFEKFKIKYFNCDMFQNISQVEEIYLEFKNILDPKILLRLVYLLYLKGRNLDCCILTQYVKECDYDIVYKLLQCSPENHTLNKLEYIWKIPYFEILANTYYKLKQEDHLNMIKNLMRRTSNHQIFKNHPLRKHFKIINFLKYIDNLEYSCLR